MALDPEATQKAPAPAPRPPLAREQLVLITALGGAAILLMTLLVPGTWGAYYAPRLWLPLWVIACLVFGGALLESRSRWVTRITRVSRNRLVEWGGGAYAAVALVCFAWLEWGRFTEFVNALMALTDKWAWRDFIRGLFDFGIDSFLNGVWAIAWPAFWSRVFTAGQLWPAVAVGWGVFASGKWAVENLAKDAAPRRPGPGPTPGTGP